MLLVMKVGMDKFFIKVGYRSRSVAPTREAEAGDYWNARRIAASARYQWYDYKFGRYLLRRRQPGARSVADVGCGYPWKVAHLLLDDADSVVLMDQPTLSTVVREHFPTLEFRALDLEQPPRARDQFDLIMFSGVIEHLIDPDPAIEFLRTSIKGDGFILISTPERDVKRGIDCME